MKIQDLSIIICSYNEEKTVCDVVAACRLFNPESEIIVIDDGSEDNSEQLLHNLAKTTEFKYIRHPNNKGKSYAMVTGIKHATHNIILFWDADSIGIRKEHFELILKPIFNNEADMVLGHTAARLAKYNLSPFKSYTGERVLLKKDLNLILNEIEDLRFGIETYINFYYESHSKRVTYVLLEGLRTLTKFEKTNLIDATKDYFKEGNEIASILLKNYKSKAIKFGTSILDPHESLKKSLLNVHQNTSKKIQNIYQKLNRQNFN